MSSDASPKDRQSLSYVLRSGLAGGVAGCVAKTVVAPLDRVKILFQASNPDFQKYAGTWSGAFRAVSQIYRENGMRGLLQGHSATLLRIAPYAAIKFMTYDQVEALLMPTRESQTNLRRFTAGAISGITSVFFTYPLELIRPAPPSAASASSTVLTAGQVETSLFTRFPVLKFYRGFTVTTIGMIPYAGTSFLFWGFLRAHFFPYREGGSKIGGGPLADLSIGAASGVLAQTVSYPFEVIRRRMQVGGLTQPDRWMRWGETVRTIWVSKGLKGFYVGLTIGYLKVIPMTAISYAVWQWERRMLHL
ncbi:mitochondrial carrier [Dichomitus squalens]|nr:mitochondrial carrier [Dichomitus squalens]